MTALVVGPDSRWTVGVYRSVYGGYGYVTADAARRVTDENGPVYFDSGDEALAVAIAMIQRDKEEAHD